MAEPWGDRVARRLRRERAAANIAVQERRAREAEKFTADEWCTFCDALRAVTVDNSTADSLPLGVLRHVVTRWAIANQREWRPTASAIRAMVRRAGYDVYNRHTRSATGKKQCRRYVRGLQLI
ncbi:hypothetical protein GCM10010330_44870 [Streptomyces tendae]|nr:hypothetical protein GCM10010330_44870 [Streptomyces tendae]